MAVEFKCDYCCVELEAVYETIEGWQPKNGYTLQWWDNYPKNAITYRVAVLCWETCWPAYIEEQGLIIETGSYMRGECVKK